jgi:hypothetical protein
LIGLCGDLCGFYGAIEPSHGASECSGAFLGGFEALVWGWDWRWSRSQCQAVSAAEDGAFAAGHAFADGDG